MSQDGPCRFKPADVGATMTAYTNIKKGDEEALMQASASVGPIAVGMDAGHQSFQVSVTSIPSRSVSSIL